MRIRDLRATALGAVVLLLSTRGACAEPESRMGQTEYSIHAVDAGVFLYQSTHGKLPEQLGEVCEAEPRWCSLMTVDDWTADAWGTAIEYSRNQESYVLTSAGRDRTFRTADDLSLDAARSRSWARRMSGCYVMSRSLPRLQSDTIKLLSEVMPGGGYHVQHPRTFDDYPVYVAKWYPLSADSLLVIWAHADRGITLRARTSGSELQARISGRNIAGRKEAC
jgi:hypothetical protein